MVVVYFLLNDLSAIMLNAIYVTIITLFINVKTFSLISKLWFLRFMVVKLVFGSINTSVVELKRKKKIIIWIWSLNFLIWVYYIYILYSWYFFISLSAIVCSHCCFYWMRQLIADHNRRMILKKILCLMSKKCLIKWAIMWQKVYFNVWKNFWRSVISDLWIRWSDFHVI